MQAVLDCHPQCQCSRCLSVCFFFFNDTAPPEIYSLSLHDALPISLVRGARRHGAGGPLPGRTESPRSEEHTSELQSPCNLGGRLLLEKKKNTEERSDQVAVLYGQWCAAATCEPS